MVDPVLLLQVRLPVTHMDLGGMETMQASVNMDAWLDQLIAIAAPVLLVRPAPQTLSSPRRCCSPCPPPSPAPPSSASTAWC